MKPKPPGRGGLRKAEPREGLSREDLVILMPEREFEASAAKHLEAAKGDHSAERRARQQIDADRRLRVWAREEGKRLRTQQSRTLGEPLSMSESPLEERMLQAFLASGQFSRVPVLSEVVVAHGPAGLLLQQLRVPHDGGGRYILDFAIVEPREDRFVAIEVDGHNFHERTPEQAQYDRQRDRRLTAAGWTVLRFTGREVYRNAKACVTEVLALVNPPSSKVGT